MSIQAMARVMASSSLTGAAYYSLLVIANHEGTDENEEDWAWPSVDTVAREARISRRAAIDGIRSAEKAGELKTLMNAGPRGVNKYHVAVAHSGGCRICTRADERSQSAPEPKELGSPVSTSLSPTAEVQSCSPSSRDELFEILYTAQTMKPYDPKAKIAPSTRVKINTARKQVLDAGFTVDEVRFAASGWTAAFGDTRMTALALAGNLDRCLSAAEGASFRATEADQKPTVLDRAQDLLRREQETERRRSLMIEGGVV